MIQFEAFDLAAPPRTGGAWALRAAERAGLAAVGGDGLCLPTFAGGYSVVVVRHPFTWLQSYYAAGAPPCPGPSEQLAEIAKHAGDVRAFIHNYLLLIPGTVSAIFDCYRADTVLKIEDFPWGMFELLCAADVNESVAYTAIRGLPVTNPGAYQALDNPALRKSVYKAELQFCDRYEYYSW